MLQFRCNSLFAFSFIVSLGLLIVYPKPLYSQPTTNRYEDTIGKIRPSERSDFWKEFGFESRRATKFLKEHDPSKTSAVFFVDMKDSTKLVADYLKAGGLAIEVHASKPTESVKALHRSVSEHKAFELVVVSGYGKRSIAPQGETDRALEVGDVVFRFAGDPPSGTSMVSCGVIIEIDRKERGSLFRLAESSMFLGFDDIAECQFFRPIDSRYGYKGLKYGPGDKVIEGLINPEGSLARGYADAIYMLAKNDPNVALPTLAWYESLLTSAEIHDIEILLHQSPSDEIGKLLHNSLFSDPGVVARLAGLEQRLTVVKQKISANVSPKKQQPPDPEYIDRFNVFLQELVSKTAEKGASFDSVKGWVDKRIEEAFSKLDMSKNRQITLATIEKSLEKESKLLFRTAKFVGVLVPMLDVYGRHETSERIKELARKGDVYELWNAELLQLVDEVPLGPAKAIVSPVIAKILTEATVDTYIPLGNQVAHWLWENGYSPRAPRFPKDKFLNGVERPKRTPANESGFDSKAPQMVPPVPVPIPVFTPSFSQPLELVVPVPAPVPPFPRN